MIRKLSIILLVIGVFITGWPPVANSALPLYYGSSEAGEVLRQIQFSDIAKHWAREPIVKMAAQGIIRGVSNNKFKPEDTLTKEQAIILLIRALGQGAKAEALAEALAAQSAEKPQSLNAFLIQGYLAAAQEEGILTEAERTALDSSRTEPAQRQEVAYWTAKALALNPVYGIAQKLIFGYKDMADFAPSYLAAIESLLQEKIMSGVSYNAFNPQGPMKRAEMAALLERINPRLAAKRSLQAEQGYLVSQSNRWDGFASRNVFEITTDSGQRFELLTGGSQNQDVIVYKNGKTGNASLLSVGDRLSFFIEPGNRINFIQAGKPANLMFFGQFKNLDLNNSRLTVLDTAGKEISFEIAKSVPVVIDNRPAALNDLVPGQDLTLNLSGQKVSSITGTFGPELAGYTPPQSGIRTGRIKNIDSGTLLLLNDSGEQEEYKLTGSTWVTREGSWKSLDHLQVGTRVKLYLSDLAAKEVDKIEIADSAGRVVRVIRGKLEQVYPESPRLALSGVKEFFYGQWYPAQGFDLVNLTSDAELYAQGRVLTLNELAKSFQGEEVYLAFTGNFGKNEGVKLVVREGEAKTYNDSIEEIDWGGNRFDLRREVSGARLNPGTIVLRDNKLVDWDDLAAADHVFLEANKTGSEINSVIVSTASFYPKEFELYRGRIDSVGENEYELDYYSGFSSNEWDKASGSSSEVELTFNSDTVITDITKSTNRLISSAKFAESRWSRYYDSDFYVYAVAKNDQTLSMTLWDYYNRPGILKTTLGRITSVNSSVQKIDLDRVSDWSESYNQWKPNDFTLSLDLKNAIVYKEDKQISLEQLKAGDNVYVLHDQVQGIIVFIQ